MSASGPSASPRPRLASQGPEAKPLDTENLAPRALDLRLGAVYNATVTRSLAGV